MIDTLILRIHGVKKYRGLIKSLDPANRKGYTTHEAKVDGKDVERLRNMGYKDTGEIISVLRMQRTGQHLVKSKVAKHQNTSNHYQFSYYVNYTANYIELNFSVPKFVYGSNVVMFVEVNQALPFLRKGSIVINGDRRIKIGNVIRYKPTGEIFFVDAVQQNFSINENVIDRTTTIQVSRGMVEQLIYGKHLRNNEGKEIFVSYFNIIDTRLNTKTIAKKVSYTEKVKTGTETVQAFDSSVVAENVTEKGSDRNSLRHPEMVEQIAQIYLDV